MINYAVGYQPEQFELPAEQSFTLPDTTSIRVIETPSEIDITIGPPAQPTLRASLEILQRTLRISPHGIVNDDRAVHASVHSLQLASGSALSTDDLWALVYALWIRRPEPDYVPLSLAHDSLSPDQRITALTYLTHTGLGFFPPDGAADPSDVLLSRIAFWQGAGAPPARSWLRSPVPSPSQSSLAPFAFVPSFTRAPNVCTVHPLRPPKPAPGTTLYARYIHAVNQTLSFTHINADDPRHFEAYCRWQNSERVNSGWKERGPQEKHRKYIEEKLKDRHNTGFLVEWDGELAGYGEMAWVKEDHMSTFVGGLGDYDQCTHLLVGEEKFRGHTRFATIMTSMKHMCFLREPRTDVVVGEPRADLPIVPKLVKALPQEVNRTFELPHKRAVYFVLRRQRFFEEGLFY